MTTRIADLPPITPNRVLALKAEAKELRQRAGIKQSAALAQIAQREGFPSWEKLMAKAGGREQVDAAKPVNESRAARRHQYAADLEQLAASPSPATRRVTR